MQHPKLLMCTQQASGLDTESHHKYYVQHPNQVWMVHLIRGTRNPLCIFISSNGTSTVALYLAVHFKYALSSNIADIHDTFWEKFAKYGLKYDKIPYNYCTLRTEASTFYSSIISSYSNYGLIIHLPTRKPKILTSVTKNSDFLISNINPALITLHITPSVIS